MPLDLYNVDTQSVESVPEQHVADALKSGRYVPRKDAKIPAISPEGELGYLDPTKAADAFKNGFSYDLKGLMGQKAVDAQNAERFDHPVAAGALAAADVLTMGTASQLVNKAGIATPGQLDMLAQQNPIATPIGTGIGLTAGLLTGEGSPGLITKTSSKIEQGVAKALFREGDGFVKTLAGKVLSKGIAGGAEGSLFATGDFIREEAMGRVDLNAESFLNYQKPFVLWGAGLGAGMGALSGTVPPAYRALSEKIQGLVGKEGASLYDRAAKTFSKYSSKLMGRAEEEGVIYRQLTDEATQKAVRMHPNDMQAELLNQAKRTTEVVKGIQDTIGDWETGKFAGIKSTINETVAVDKALQNAEDMYTVLRNRLDNLNHPENAFIAEKEMFKSIEHETNKLRSFIDKAKKAGDTDSWGVYERLNATKKTLDDISKAGQKVVGYSAEQTTGYARETAGMLRESLMDNLRWGEAGRKQAVFNEAFHDIKTAIDGSEIDLDKPGIADLFLTKGRPDLVKAQNVAKKMANDPAYAAQHGPRIEKFFEQIRKYDETMRKELGSGYANAEVTKEGFDAIVADAVKGQEKIQFINAARKDAVDLLKGNQGAGISFPEMVVSAIGGMLGGFPGSALGLGVAKLLSNPGRTTQIVMSFKSAQIKTLGDIARGVSTFFRPVGRVATTLAPASTYALAKYTPSGVKAKSREAGFKEWERFLGEHAQNPGRVMDNLAHNVGPFAEVMPKAAAMAQQKSLDDLNYLQSIMPQNPHNISPFDNNAKDWVPNKEQMAKFERAVNIIHNPLSAIDHLKKGILTQDEVATLKAVRPALYSEMLNRVMFEISEKSAKIPFNKKAHLSTLFGVPFDSSLTGGAVLDLQKNYMKPLANEQTQYPNQGPKVKLPSATEGLTESQRISAKKGGM